MTKFNVGDKVIFNKENAHVAKQFDYKINKPYEVQEVFPFHHTVQIINEKGSSHSFDEERFELVETKPTKNQRITALENEVAELKLIVHELRDGRKTMRDVMNEVLSEPSTPTVEDIIEFEGQQYRKVDREVYEGDVIVFYGSRHPQITDGKPYKVFKGKNIEENKLSHTADSGTEYPVDGEYVDGYYVYELIKGGLNPQIPIVDETIEPLTPNQQRFLTIINAKRYVAERQAVMLFGHVDFIVNTEKRTIVALLKLLGLNQVVKRGIAKCNPSDVFNEHIGKAIALGRALGLDVSEFEQSVQPNEVVLGHIIVWNESPDEPHEVVTKNGDWFDFIYLKDNKRYNNHEYCEIEEFTTILNDSNAKYEVES
ncbi:hypothetical protein QH639_22400 [Lysinibacillus sp. 1 U-2021]|uniref:hypothetical protein n=1 Tax=Lysinibacillus sp. 1 U-2021 TaxID=3039426 RepID=UPI00247FE999|nr:hypothetical protein [Lysinibacillus sp. 1 U-2021]WGT38527.1 hypothetical protein QH639_22400 [Lysinibacillus sp. 1 U-2021]